MLYEPEFTNYLQSVGMCAGTIRKYTQMLQLLDAFMVKIGKDDVRRVTEADIHAFVDDLEHRDYAAETLYRHLGSLKRYFAYLEQAGYLYISPTAMMRLPKNIRHHHRAYGEDEIRAILDQLRTDTPFRIRGKAMLELGYSSALRPREIRCLKLSDIDTTGGKLFIEQSKNKKDRIVPVGDHALAWLNRYLETVRPRFIKDRRHPFVFINLVTGNPLTGTGLTQTVRETCRQSGIDPIVPYSLRCTAATNLLNRGMSIVHIGRILGHTNIGTTQVYLRTKDRELAAVITNAHPRFGQFQEEEDHETGSLR